jgi:hypothetical protein
MMTQVIVQDLVVSNRRRTIVGNVNHFEGAGESIVYARRCHLSFPSLALVPVSARGQHKQYRGALSRSDHPRIVIGMYIYLCMYVIDY